jgi:DnaK suppressor protein
MDHQQIQRQLLHRRQELLGRLHQLSADVHHRDTPLDADLGEQALELENLDVLFELDESSRRELSQINNALLRLDNHEYEFCAKCGDQIGESRLEVLPFVDTCIRCAA